MELCNVEGIQKLVGFFKALRRLAATAHHHINTDKSIGHQSFHLIYFISKQLAVVMAVHQFEHCVAAALQGNVEMRHEGTAVGTIVYQLIAHQVGFQTADAIAADAFHLVESLHQVNEAFAGGLAEIADVHAREHNLLATVGSCLAGLLYY